jgi:quercetin dioxygenase-like cupin family protein
MPVVRVADVPAYTYSMPGVDSSKDGPQLTVQAYAAPSKGSTQICAWRVVFAPHLPQRGGTVDHEYIAVVLSGRVEADLDGVHYALTSQDALIVPPYTSIRLANPHDEPAEMMEMVPVGTKVKFSDEGEAFVPPWAR